MAKQKDKKSGKELFYEYYSELYGNRFDELVKSLFLEPVYFTYQFNSESKEYFLDSGSVLAGLCLPVENAVTQASSVSSNSQNEESANVIKSPIVGTFYRAPSPDAPVYCEVGKTIKKGQPLCILEAMKMMNTLEAEYDCVIEEILVANGELVEFDQPIFKVKKV
jgi:biotin carboxyl carrier protein